METIKLNLIPGLNNPVCHVSQYDIGRVIKFELYEGSTIYTLDGTETLTLIVRKPDNTIYTTAITNTSSDYITISTVEQICPLPGYNTCELKVEKNDTVINSINFLMFVEEDPYYNGVQSETGIENLTTQIKDIMEHIGIGGGLFSTHIVINSATYTSRELES